MNLTARKAGGLAAVALVAALAVPGIGREMEASALGLSHPVHARFIREVRRADEFAFYSMAVLGQEVDVSALGYGRKVRAPSEYRGDIGGLLRKVACLSGLRVSFPRADLARFEEGLGNGDECGGVSI